MLTWEGQCKTHRCRRLHRSMQTPCKLQLNFLLLLGRKSCRVSAAPASVEAAWAPGGLVFLLPSWCVYTLHRGIYSVQEEKQQREFPVGPPPTASISSHSHSQSVLNVSHALSLPLSRCVFAFASVRPWQLKCICPPRRCSNSLYFPDSEIVPRSLCFAARRRRRCQGGA